MKLPSISLLTVLVAILFSSAPASGGASEDLMKLSQDYWEDHLRRSPVEATSIGDHRYDHLLDDISPEGVEAQSGVLRGFLSRLEKLNPEDLSPPDRITADALRFELRSGLAGLECGLDEWTVDPMGGPQIEFMNIPSYQPLRDPASGEAMVARWRAMGPYLDQHIANLRRGLASGKTGTRDAVERVIQQITEFEGMPVAEWALLSPATDVPEDWTAAEREAFKKNLETAVREEIRPALIRYRDFLAESVLPAARGQERPGVMHVEGGPQCYQKMILRHTSLDLPPEEIHQIGMAEVERINDEMRELGKKVLGTGDLEEIHQRLRTDPALHFTTRDEVQAKAEEALRRAEEAAPDWFGILPQAPCRVVRMEPHEEKHSTIAYYRQPAMDGSRPGSYYINTYAPETRPRYEAEALAFHEAVPGHHLQIAIMQELTGLPEFRKHSGVTAYVEGWGLYTERLSREMGLYTGDMDLFGMLSYDSWRACRLVVDTGMHALGWSRQEAIDFMIANTILAENNIVNEVDRYITWPGQALAYKLGQREIFRLRALARERLGERFDIKGFHDTVLGEGAVDLATLAALVEEWIEETKKTGE